VNQAEARREQSLNNYELAIQNAFRDVDDSLVAVKQSAELRDQLRQRVATLKHGVDLAWKRYENGYSDYLTVLDTERSLFSAELQLASARGDYQRAFVNLYRALGGDWTSASSASAMTAQPGTRKK
jgi:multidrug efflux system outer membrane protein